MKGELHFIINGKQGCITSEHITQIGGEKLMTREEAKEKAEMGVYVSMNRGDIEVETAVYGMAQRSGSCQTLMPGPGA